MSDTEKSPGEKLLDNVAKWMSEDAFAVQVALVERIATLEDRCVKLELELSVLKTKKEKSDDRMEYVLSTIRYASSNEDETAQWMQRWAAWAMEPGDWIKPDDEPPSV